MKIDDLKIDWKNQINWPLVVLNLRAAGLSSRKLSFKTRIKSHKLRQITADRSFTINLDEANRLMDLHLIKCPEKHNERLLNG